jgi:apolipoprotein N-acyltransferase
MTAGAATPSRDWRGGRRGAALALVAGASLPLAFAPVNLHPLAVIAPAILFWLWIDAAPRRAALTGYLFGLGYFALGVSWVSVSMYRFSGMGLFFSGLATALFVLFLALFPAALGWLSRRWFAPLRKGMYWVLCLPTLWVLLEWVRGWIFTGFPWLALGYSQTDAPLGGLAPLLGVYGVSWAVALSAGLLLCVWRASGRQRLIALAAAVLLWAGAGLLSLVEWSRDEGSPLSVSLVQGNVPQELKWRPEQRQYTIELYTSLSRPRWDRDIVLWPETALPAFYHDARNFLRVLAQEAQANGGATLVTGLPVMPPEEEGAYYNAVVRVGAPDQFYFKSHLVPFGEYIPFKALLGDLLDLLQVPMSDFSRGAIDQPLLEIAGVKAGVSICYEDAFGEEVIRGLPQANLLINVSNDAWFGDSFAPHQHLQMARMRTLETARPMLRATNNGVSAIIDHRGRVLSTTPQFQVAVLDGEVQPRAGATPYARVGNWLIVSLMMLMLLVVYLLRGKPGVGS